MKTSKQLSFKKGKVTIVKDMPDYSKEEFFVKKAAQAKKILVKAKFPKELALLKTIL